MNNKFPQVGHTNSPIATASIWDIQAQKRIEVTAFEDEERKFIPEPSFPTIQSKRCSYCGRAQGNQYSICPGCGAPI